MDERDRSVTGKRIVIADDEALIRMGVRAILEDAGHMVVGEASTGSDALRIVPEVVPDIVLLDIRMPAPDGIEVARRLRAEFPVPVVFLTAFSDRRLLFEAADAGGYGYIVKPVREGEILAAVAVAGARWNELHAAKDALETRKLVERAKGILMRRLNLSEDDAHHLLHRRSRHLRKAVREVARDILETDQAIRRPSVTK
ncbi:MAG: ANTAR domain-containing response regulator [bacterium]